MFDEIAAEEDERRRHGCTMAIAGFSAAIESPAESRVMSSFLAR
jgi:hypothetical protein